MTAAPPSRAPVEIGQVLADKYVVENVLGVGGMGVVVAARHRFLGGRVALKFVLPELAQSAQVVRRFLKEAQAATQITSEHVARVTDVGTLENGAPYMVMEYMEGRDLGAVLEERGALPVTDAVDYVLQALQAVAEAHSKGIVHRDLKPSNLFLTQRPGGAPLVKVLDFGIAKAVALDASSGAPGADLTRTGAMMGSPLYMSPEQIRSSKAVDARADVWSIGVILHELLTRNHPFSGDTQGAVLAAILTEPAPPIRRARPDLPEAIERTILACLEKSLERRLPSVAMVAERLAPYGSSDAQVSWSRISQISGTWSGAHGTDRSGPLSVAGAIPAATAPSASRAPTPPPTSGDWAGTNPGIDRPKRSRTGVLMGAAAVVVLAAAGGAALWARGSPTTEASDEAQREAQSAAALAPTAALPVVPRPQPETAPAAPSPPVIASAVVSAPAQGAPVPAAVRAVRSPSRRPSVAQAPPAPPAGPKPPEPAAPKATSSKPKPSQDLGGLIERRE